MPTFSSSYLDQDGHPWHLVIDRTDEAAMAATVQAAEEDGTDLPSERLTRLILIDNEGPGVQLLGWHQVDDGTLYFINLTTTVGRPRSRP